MKETNNQIAGLLKKLNGIDVSKYDDSFLNKSLQKRITETHCSSAEEYCAFLEQNIKEGKYFFDSIQISYSDFFRNPLTFAVLERVILPSLVLKKKNAKHKEIRIWSAACAAGQEAYSLAMLMEELVASNSDKINYRIFATDQSESQLDEAHKGQYAAKALNNMNMKRTGQWFTKHGETYTVKQELKEHIDFSVFDLFDEQLSCPPASIFGDFDLEVCANILFYYKSKYRKIILKKIGGCLASGGFLATGEAERNIFTKHNYHEIFPQSAIFRLYDAERKNL